MPLSFDIHTVPFSRYGSFLTVSYLNAAGSRPEGVYLRTVRGGDLTAGAAFRIELLENQSPVVYQVQATPTRLRLKSARGYADLCICSAAAVRWKSHGVGVRLTLEGGDYDYAMQLADNRWEINSFLNEVRFMANRLQGTLSVDAPWNRTRCTHVALQFEPDDDGCAEFTIEEYRTVWQELSHSTTFEQDVEQVDAEFQQWLTGTLQTGDPALSKGRELAAYITWSCIVPKGGYLTRSAMYMSKNWMTNIWSWDHCFNAMALIRSNPELAWDQYMIFFDRQDESGLLPDFMNDKYALWNCNKPPIHGWTLLWMMERSDWIGERQLLEVYEPLSRWTRWWFNYRDDDRDGVPQYNHGNDSGWDNSTIFHERGAVESPDLCAYLVLQCEVLMRIAERIGRPHDGTAWRNLRERTLALMLEHFWHNGEMRALRSGSHEPLGGDSLLVYLPIILADRLSADVKEWLVNGLADSSKFLAPHGFATESLSSEAYESDGYWRGPIWAPVMMLLVDGLVRAGERGLAQTAADRFCRMAEKSGMAENFNAMTGEGLRDRAFTWTSSVYLMLAHEYITEASS
ncbi:trehalase family glycosidase [Paenibacillus sp. UMB4589-SE434]|uniref:amylo-alpha-1,6-glucosidase n=1 Tax=Paenibacillus sp. UMB4589-SE434 TaxID=3046314 RepID=UPI00254B13A3|nr:trehalase family glycosidase [Paenibacillus sp. UMB4589-SE434]MDK8183201.1 trehalase family glycosidase [Paenibacillus sp. UMB4589-SE434]